MFIPVRSGVTRVSVPRRGKIMVSPIIFPEKMATFFSHRRFYLPSRTPSDVDIC